MSVVVIPISKGKLQQAIEQVSNSTSEQRQAFLEALQSSPNVSPPPLSAPWIEFLVTAGALDRANAGYIYRTWWPAWPEAYHVEAIMRQSLIEALTLADTLAPHAEPPFPLDCQWIFTSQAPGKESFQVLLTYNTRQVTRILLTPPLPTQSDLPLQGFAPYFAVEPQHQFDAKLEAQLPRTPTDPTDPLAPFLETPRQTDGLWYTVQFRNPE